MKISFFPVYMQLIVSNQVRVDWLLPLPSLSLITCGKNVKKVFWDERNWLSWYKFSIDQSWCSLVEGIVVCRLVVCIRSRLDNRRGTTHQLHCTYGIIHVLFTKIWNALKIIHLLSLHHLQWNCREAIEDFLQNEGSITNKATQIPSLMVRVYYSCLWSTSSWIHSCQDGDLFLIHRTN